MKTKKARKISFQDEVLIAMIAGAIVGFIVGPKISVIKIVGDVFLRMLRMAIVPMILCNVIVAIAKIGDLKKLGSFGIKMLALFMGTTLVSTTIGLVVAKILSPGAGLTLENVEAAELAQTPTFSSIVANMFPVNIMQSMAEGNMLQVIVFAIFAGVTILVLKEADRDRITGIFAVLARYFTTILRVVMFFLPIGVFALMAVTAGMYGTKIIGPIGKYIVAIYVGLAMHVLLTYFGLYTVFTRKNPFTLVKNTRAIWTTSLSTCSTAVTLPVSMETSKRDLGLREDIVDFVLPVGATMNMDGNGLWFGVLAIFVFQMLGLPVSIPQLFTAVLLGVLMTLGSPGIPGGIFVASTVFLTTLGVPAEVIGAVVALLAGIFRIMDMGITTVNVFGSVVVASVLNAIESRAKKIIKHSFNG